MEIKDTTDDKILNISDIRAKHIGQIIKIKGQVCCIEDHKPYFKLAAFECTRCGHITIVSQDNIMVLEQPFLGCENDTCGKKGPFKIIYSESNMGDLQEILISDSKRSLKVFLLGDLVNTVELGSNLIFVGELINVSKRPQTKYEYGFLATEILE